MLRCSLPFAQAIVGLAFLLSVTEASATIPDPPRGSSRVLEVVNVTEAPVIDGQLDEAAWTQAKVADGFWISERKSPPSEATEVRVLADGENLYFAFFCFDSQPGRIRARQRVRDASQGFDDQVSVEIDSFHDHRNISKFFVNAIGTQADVIAGGRARKIEWKGDWSAAVARNDDGWTVEIAIPFEMLNSRRNVDTFGINFVRYHRRTRERSRWADVTTQFKREEMGHITGFEPPASRKDDPFAVMPFVLVGSKVADKRGRVKDTLFTAGVDLRYEPKQDRTAVVSINPDFSQVERQVTDINFSYVEKFTPDARPFFQEGSAYFYSGDTRFFYSNRIPNIDGGLKFFAQTAESRIGVLATKAVDSRFDGVVQVDTYVSDTSTVRVGFVGTARDELKNELATLSWDARQASGTFFNLGVAATHTDNAGPGGGSLLEGTLGWEGDYWLVSTKLDNYDDAFVAANGLTNIGLIGTRGIESLVSFTREYGDTSIIRSTSANISHEFRQTEDGDKQRGKVQIGGEVESRQDIRVGAYYFQGDYREPDRNRYGQFSNRVNDDYFWTVTLDFNTRSTWLGYGGGYSQGDLGGDDYRYPFVYAYVSPTLSTNLSASWERLENFGVFNQLIVSGSWNITPEQGLSARVIDTDFGQSFRAAYRRQVVSGFDAFLVYNEEPFEDPSVSLKVVLTVL